MDEPKLFPEQPEPEEHVRKQAPQNEAYSNVTKNITTLGSRLRSLEEQYTTLRNRSQLTDSNLLEFEKDLRHEIKDLNQEVLEMKRMIQHLSEKVKIVSSEMENAVKEHEFKVVEKYVDIWDPSRFVTKEQLKQAFEKLKKER